MINSVQDIKSSNRLHIFICVNDRSQKPDDERPSCGPRVTESDVKALKKWIIEQGLMQTVFCTKTGCLGFCHADGSNAVVYPRGRFVRFQDINDLKQLILEELSQAGIKANT
jgi:(2Fe-2S) ferredoxin